MVKSSDPARARLSDALARVGGGDRDALREVYALTSAKLFGVCLRISQDREAAEDILQDVYLKVWNRAGRFDAERASPITWLCIIARNTAIDWRRTTGPAMLPEAAAFDIADDRASATDLIEADQDRARIFDCLDALEERQSNAIRAAFYEGRTYLQLAEIMKVPLGTMKSWVRRGLMQLKGCLDG
ncbi:MAG: sigma-70 family RNA polymerase sigma factor [Sphingomonadales bacterium]|nr:MAG: sigma-70 family RNA polymerase sigma factor [Sphingomonadales bacterium]